MGWFKAAKKTFRQAKDIGQFAVLYLLEKANSSNVIEDGYRRARGNLECRIRDSIFRMCIVW